MATPRPAAMAMAAFVESPPAAAAPSAAMATPTLRRVMPKALKSENNFFISVLLSSDLCLPLLYPHPRNDGHRLMMLRLMRFVSMFFVVAADRQGDVDHAQQCKNKGLN